MSESLNCWHGLSPLFVRFTIWVWYYSIYHLFYGAIFLLHSKIKLILIIIIIIFFFFHVKIIIIAHNVDLSIQSQISKQKSEKDEITAEKERHNDEAKEEVRTLILIVWEFYYSLSKYIKYIVT